MELSQAKVIPMGNEQYNVSYGDDSGLYVEFYMRAVKNEFRSSQEGRPIYENKEYIRIQPLGDKTKVIDRPVQKFENGGRPSDLERFPRQWQKFLSQESQVSDGTPIQEWAPIGRAEAMELKGLGFHTVEMLAKAGEVNINFPGGRKLRDMAIAWLEKAQGGSPISKLQSENEDLKLQVQALQNQINGLGVSEPKKRGPKPKSENEE